MSGLRLKNVAMRYVIALVGIVLTSLVGAPYASSQERSVYWIGAGRGDEARFSTIFRYSLDRGTIDTLVQGREIERGQGRLRKFYSLAVDSVRRQIYWTDSGGTNPDGSVNIGAIMRASLDGGAVEAMFRGVVCGLGIPTDIEVDPVRRRLYWSIESDCPANLASVDIDNYDPRQANQMPTNGPHSVRAIEVDQRNQTLFWVNGNVFRTPPGVYRAPLGSTVQDARIVPGDVCDIALDRVSSRLYLVDCNSSTIRRANLDGTMAEVVFVSQAQVSRLAVDHQGRKLYWTESSAGKIRRTNLDGTGVEDILSGLVMPTGLALGFGQGLRVAVDPEAGAPGRTGLLRVYPNPVQESATMTFALTERAHVTIEVYDGLGRRLDVLVAGEHPPGTHQIQWNPTGQANGVYFLRMASGDESATIPLVLQR